MVRVELRVAGDMNYHFQQDAAEFQILKQSQGTIIEFMGKKIIVKGTKLEFYQSVYGSKPIADIRCAAVVQATAV